jgi:hypothetical protein
MIAATKNTYGPCHSEQELKELVSALFPNYLPAPLSPQQVVALTISFAT